MALSPNGKTIAVGYHNGNVKLWDVETREFIARWSGHTKYVCALCWSGDGKRVLSGSWDGTARVWDVESSQPVLTIKTGHRWVNVVIYSPDYTQIGTGGYDKSTVKTWDAKTARLGYMTQLLGSRSPFWRVTHFWSKPSPCLRMTTFYVHQIIQQCVYGISTQTFQSDHSSSMKLK
ncbi:WD40-repeat-containing domain protein [Suillus variegatus]|nr:WD40-repeat-containing domain protein [Suillus variegatus]